VELSAVSQLWNYLLFLNCRIIRCFSTVELSAVSQLWNYLLFYNCGIICCFSSEARSFRVQTRRVSQTIVFRYREIGGRLGTKHRKK
jgi:hypothetical protein